MLMAHGFGFSARKIASPDVQVANLNHLYPCSNFKRCFLPNVPTSAIPLNVPTTAIPPNYDSKRLCEALDPPSSDCEMQLESSVKSLQRKYPSCLY